jgi:hypothetical protein
MDCNRAQELFSDHLDGTLDLLLRSDLEAHLAACLDCRALREKFAQVVSGLRGAPEIEPPVGLARRAALAALAAVERSINMGAYLLERKDRLVEDVRLLRVVIGTAFEGRVERVNDRVDDYKKLLEKRREAERDQQQRKGGAAAIESPIRSAQEDSTELFLGEHGRLASRNRVRGT